MSLSNDAAKVLFMVGQELETAGLEHLPLNSAHEAYAVILEELDEFWEEVRKNHQKRDRDRMREELIQVAAMACRTILDLKLS